jgi:NADPH:quinone reductase-like Zn-dependent oxidoreductase
MVVEMAKTVFDAHVTGVCSGKNADFVKGLGALDIIDYTQGDLKDLLKDRAKYYDLVFDCVGGDEYWELSQLVLKPKGVFTTAVGPYAHGGKMVLSKLLFVGSALVWRKTWYSRSYNFIMTIPTQFPSDLEKWIAEGKVRPQIGQVLSLDEAEKAHDLSRSHRAKGKIILKVA